MTLPAPTCIEERIWDALNLHPGLTGQQRLAIYTAITAKSADIAGCAWVSVWTARLKTGNTLRHAVVRHNPGVMPMTMPSDVHILTALEKEGTEQ